MRILLVEDDDDDYVITRRLLSEIYGGRLLLEWERDYDSALRAIENNAHDVYLIDYMLGGNNGLDLVKDAESRETTAAMIILTGQSASEIDVLALSAGASDYLEKADLSPALLDRAIRYAIERKKAEQRLAALARHDPLTGLVNRAAFRARLESDIHHCDRTGSKLAILLVDLDNFKDVNDTLGHPLGDALIEEIARRLESLVRDTDTVARLGGDEFAVITTHLHNASESTVVAEKVLAELSRAARLGSHEVDITASMGIVVYPQDGRDPDDLLRHADLALYAVKSEGRNGFRFFDRQMNTTLQARKAMERAMRVALSKRSFFLQFQPKLDMQNGRIIGVEALARWYHPERGSVSPVEFIPIAEETGLILPLGEMLLRMACEQSMQWQRAGLPALSMAVNLSAVQLRRCDFVETLGKVLDETGMDATQLELEITEGVIMDQTRDVISALESLRALGVRLAIDDFGTGYSSLSYLKRFRVDTLKIDRSFVHDIGVDPDDAAINRAIIQLGTSLDLNVVAEGVESEGQAAFLRRHGCRWAQGYHFSEPLCAEEFEAYWRSSEQTGRLRTLQPGVRR